MECKDEEVDWEEGGERRCRERGREREGAPASGSLRAFAIARSPGLEKGVEYDGMLPDVHLECVG